MTTTSSALAVWDGVPVRVFHDGEHIFPADLDALRELAVALAADLREEHHIPTALVRRTRAEDEREATDPALVRPLELPRLRAFLAQRRPAFDATARGHIVEATRAYGHERVEQLRAMEAPDVLIDHALAQLARLAEAGWSPTVDLSQLVPNAVAAAAIVELDSHRLVDSDITDLVLLAAQSCTSPDARALHDASWTDELDWTPLAPPVQDDPAPFDGVTVRGALYPDRCDRLAFAVIPPDRASVGATALLAVSIPAA